MTLPTNSGKPVRIWLYANTEPMLKTEKNGDTIIRKQLMTLENASPNTQYLEIDSVIIDSVWRLYRRNLS